MYTTQMLSLSFLANWSKTVANEDFRTKCLSFKPEFGDAKVERIEHLAKGSSAALPYRHQTCGGPGNSAKLAQDVCRVALRINTSDRSGIHFEVWFPRGYSGRVLATGNGGLNGCRFQKLVHLFLD
jgi:feruloyl esterase